MAINVSLPNLVASRLCAVLTTARAALRLVRAWVLCQISGPLQTYNQVTTPTNCGPPKLRPGCCSTNSTPLNAALTTATPG